MNRAHLSYLPVRMLTGLLLTTVLALSVHLVMLQGLGIPFPDLSRVPLLLLFLNRVVQALALLIFCRIAFSGQSGPGFLRRWGTTALLVAMLNEAVVRGPFMDGYCGNALRFAFVADLPKLLATIALCGIAVAVSVRLIRPWQMVLGAVGVTALVMFAITPVLGLLTAPIVRAASSPASSVEWCQLPYGTKVLVPAYFTFLEPVLGCLGAVALMWRKLPAPGAKRLLFFTLLIMALKSQLIAPFIYAAVARPPLGVALASDGQFGLEALTLALMIGLTWIWSVPAAQQGLGEGYRTI